MWWDGLTSVDQNLQHNINKLVIATEDTKLSEVNAWADASRQKEQPDDSTRETAETRGKIAIKLWGVAFGRGVNLRFHRGSHCQLPKNAMCV